MVSGVNHQLSEEKCARAEAALASPTKKAEAVQLQASKGQCPFGRCSGFCRVPSEPENSKKSTARGTSARAPALLYVEQ